jgi:hypothetical protein
MDLTPLFTGRYFHGPHFAISGFGLSGLSACITDFTFDECPSSRWRL